MSHNVFFFGAGKAEGNARQKELLGGKGAGLAEMTNLGIPVPPGFTITTEVSVRYMESGRAILKPIEKEIDTALAKVEEIVGAKLGDPSNPLLVSVRSGARASMPGMMDTILNLGLNDDTVLGLAKKTNNPRFAWDAYRRFITMYSDVVLGLKREAFEEALDEARAEVAKSKGFDPRMNYGEELKRRVPDSEIGAEQLETLVAHYKQLVQKHTGKPFPQEVRAQLWGAIEAVFHSWQNPRAVTYRKIHDIPSSWGTACNVQAMVFGNMGESSATGVAFTRDPSTGEKRLLGEWLPNAQGEDVVAGIRTPRKISKGTGGPPEETLEVAMPETYAEFISIAHKLEDHFNDMQDIEFTIQEGKLYLLQCRSGKRSGKAALKIAIELVKQGRLSEDEALLRVDPESLNQLLHPVLDPEVVQKTLPIARGLNASPGAAVGAIVFTADEAERRAGRGEAVILVRTETSPEDIHGMKAAKGILTARGGMTCIAPETRILTDRGFLTAERAFGLFEDGAPLKILSFDHRSLRPVWRAVVAAGRKPSEVVSIAVSQTGRAEGNVLRMTADHKMFVLADRKLKKKRLDEVLKDEDFLTLVDEIPAFGEVKTTPALAYLCGALFSDGYINVKDTKGYVTFIQKPTDEKQEFIAAVEQAMLDSFGVGFTYVRERLTVATLKGRTIEGSVEDRICFRREPAARLAEIRDHISEWVLSLDSIALLHFLAGFVDGDGTFAEESSGVRLQISFSHKKMHLVEGVSLACLRLGIVPQLTNNRENYTLQIAERVEDIVAFTRRVRPEVGVRSTASKCFSVRALLSDVVDQVNYLGRVREGIKRNIMFGADKLRRDILPLAPGDSHRELQAILDAPLRSYRASVVDQAAEKSDVYNFEVEAIDDLDKNFVVFSSRMTPVLVSNSHAAVVARGMGTPCVAGTSAISVDERKKTVRVAVADEAGRNVQQLELKEGDVLSLDGGTGAVYRGALPLKPAQLSGDYSELMAWADARRTLHVRTNGDTPKDARTARNYGAEGIGLCRTEHMFFGDDRINAMREVIVASSKEERMRGLAKLLPFQREDFEGIFREMRGLPVTIRLLDPPLHEFLPHTAEQIEHVASVSGIKANVIKRRAEELFETNPMLGHRGVRLAITYPEIYAMQTRAILEAAITVTVEGIEVLPEIMIPLTLSRRELEICKDIVESEAKKVFAEQKKTVHYLYGTMIELPRAALRAGDLAEVAEFFSFGTNDLTQTTLGISRDDADKTFLPVYVAQGILAKSPFTTIDQDGVGELVKIAKERGRATRKGIKLGICGEHGGDPASVEFFHQIGLDYVSCSPFRVPIARLAAAQAAIRSKGRQAS